MRQIKKTNGNFWQQNASFHNKWQEMGSFRKKIQILSSNGNKWQLLATIGNFWLQMGPLVTNVKLPLCPVGNRSSLNSLHLMLSVVNNNR